MSGLHRSSSSTLKNGLPPQELLDDLCSRFVLNVPKEDQQSFEGILFLVEYAHWFYEDNAVEKNLSLNSFTLKEFTSLMFNSCDVLRPYVAHIDDIFKDFTSYKVRVPVTGAIILDDSYERVAVFVGGVDTSATETKGTVLIHSAEQLENYAKTEEAKVEELIKAVADSGAKVIVSGAAVGEMALHFCERYKLMVLKISSKFELRRFCRTTGAVALLKLGPPNPDDLGYVDSVSVEEIGGVRVTIVRNEEGGNSVCTVVLRGSTDSILDDLERAVDDGVNTYKAMCRDSRMVPGAAATEIELARRLKEFSFKETGLDQYAIAKFAESFEMVPKTLAENAGLNAMEIISSLYAEHASGNTKVGIDLEEGVCKDVSPMNIWDLHVTKFFALKYAADAACTVLRVDQIIMAKPAGGPRREQPAAGMDED